MAYETILTFMDYRAKIDLDYDMGNVEQKCKTAVLGPTGLDIIVLKLLINYSFCHYRISSIQC